MTIEIEKAVLDKACKEIIETILFCLPSAYAGTIYRIGNPPALITKRIASGIMNGDRDKISWGLVARSGYNPPGKPWIEYRDEPDRPLEAMALVGLGFRNISMAPASLGPVKTMIRSLSAEPLGAYLETLYRLPDHSLREKLRAFSRDHGVVVSES